MNSQRIESASKEMVSDGHHNLVLSLNRNTHQITKCGDNIWMNVLKNHPKLMVQLETALLASICSEEEGTILQFIDNKRKYQKLFACPGTKSWKGVQKIRSQLSKYLEVHGYGHNRNKKYGEGQPPIGWPVLVDWATFKGPSKSTSITVCTEIILSFIDAENVDYRQHHDGPEEDEVLANDVIDVEQPVPHQETHSDLNCSISEDDLQLQLENSLNNEKSEEECEERTGKDTDAEIAQIIADVVNKENENNPLLLEQQKNAREIKRKFEETFGTSGKSEISAKASKKMKKKESRIINPTPSTSRPQRRTVAER